MHIARCLWPFGFAVALAAAAPAGMAQVPASAHFSRLIGIAVDSIHGGPLAGASVLLDGTTLSTVTDSNGTFRIDSILPGDYRIAVFHPLLDRLGIAIATLPLRLGADSVREVIVGTPSGETMIDQSCSPASMSRGPNALLGRVEHPDSHAPVQGVRVSVVWSETRIGAGIGLRRGPVLRNATTDENGRYVICGLPERIRATVQAELGSSRSGEVPVDIGGARLTLLDIGLLPGVPSAGVPLIGRAELTGRVIDQAGRPVDGASITVQDAESRGITDSTGGFRLSRLPSGTRAVIVRKIGFAPSQIAADLSASTPARVTVRLDKAAQALETVEVVGKYEAALQKNGFLDRKRQGLGRYMTTEDIQGRNAPQFSDLFHTAPGFRVDRGMGGNIIRATRSDNGCVTVWVDRVQHRDPQPGEMDSYLQPQEVMAIETYSAASAPFEFTDHGRSSCSVIVVWTNRTIR